MSKKYVALDGNVFVKEKKIEHKIGVFTIPDNLDIDYTFGTVVSVGSGSYENGLFVPVNLSVGDEVVFPRTVGNKTHFNDEEELILGDLPDDLKVILDKNGNPIGYKTPSGEVQYPGITRKRVSFLPPEFLTVSTNVWL